MKFKDKIKLVYLSVKNFVITYKKASIITAASVVLVAVILVVVFCIIIPRWEYSHKLVGDTGYTQSEIDEIGDWWQEYIQGDNIYNEGNMPIDK